MAHWSLSNSKFAECIHFCRTGLKYSKDREVVAQLIQWFAISEFHLDGVRDKFWKSLAKARELSPHDKNIAHNLQLLERVKQANTPEVWSLSGEIEVSEFASLEWKPMMAEQSHDLLPV
jgi:hypothetical protein